MSTSTKSTKSRTPAADTLDDPQYGLPQDDVDRSQQAGYQAQQSGKLGPLATKPEPRRLHLPINPTTVIGGLIVAGVVSSFIAFLIIQATMWCQYQLNTYHYGPTRTS